MMEYLLWVDVETTGLNAGTDYLLEIAAVITDLDGEKEYGTFHRTIYYPEWIAACMRRDANEYVRNMHDKTGLWERLPDGQNLEDVDQDFLEWIKSVAPEPRQVRLAGNSVRLDLNFMEVFLPDSYGHLHYRSVDVTALAYVMADCWGVVDGYYEKEKTHSAVEDIRESIEEYNWIKVRLKDLLEIEGLK